MLYGRVADRLYLHGSTGAGSLRRVAAGAPANVCVTLIDGIVVADNLFNSSANYRSAVVRGNPTRVTADEAYAALTAMSDRLIPGRGAEVRRHTDKELAATLVLMLPITDDNWTAKVRTGPPGDPDVDPGRLGRRSADDDRLRHPDPGALGARRNAVAGERDRLRGTSLNILVDLTATTRPNPPSWRREPPRSDGIGRKVAGIPAAPRPRTPETRRRRVSPSRPTSHIAASAVR